MGGVCLKILGKPNISWIVIQIVIDFPIKITNCLIVWVYLKIGYPDIKWMIRDVTKPLEPTRNIFWVSPIFATNQSRLPSPHVSAKLSHAPVSATKK